ncbi:MAG TPA: ATP cone domain-containing protein [Thermoanaerobaculia bacterium]|nr:ATP cone domain-containing protein [Thermoanaerobaculia bacterium]
MDCPFCGGSSRVVDSRPGKSAVRRRRECDRCHDRFSTLETLSVGEIRVKKKGARPSEPFDQAKLLRSLHRVTRDLSLSEETLLGVVRGIELYAVRRGRGIIESADIAKVVAESLKDADELAHHRFISNYRQPSGEVRFTTGSPDDPRKEDGDQLVLFNK